MSTMFENFDVWVDDTLEDDKPFVVAVKDRESDDERWVLASFSIEEAKALYKYLGARLEK